MKNAGFSLIAMSILLTAAALIFVSFLPGKEAGDTNIKMTNNQQKLEKVEEAMRSFMAFNGRRPCPADGLSVPGVATFGEEAAGPGSCINGTPVAPLGPDAGTGYIVGGTIPTRTLGLDDSYAFDEWGRRFTYVVDTRATKNSSCVYLEGLNSIRTTPIGSGGLVIEHTTGGAAIDNTMYAYISHGASGYGAFPAQGASTPAGRINSGSTDGDMQTNAGVDAHFPGASAFTYNTTNFTNVKIQNDRVASTLPTGGADTGFDDFVWYRSDLKNTCCLGPKCTPPGFIMNGTAAWENLGGSSSGSIAVGDVNGDGINDVVILGGYCAYVVLGINGSGYPDPLPVTPNVSTAPNIFKICTTDFTVLSSVAVGDVNGDGIPDIILGESLYNANQGRVYVVFGKSSWTSTSYNLATGGGTNLMDGTQGFQIIGETGDNMGFSVAAGNVHGAVNGGKPISDVIIGAPGTPAASAGKVYVVFGNTGIWPTSPAMSVANLAGNTGTNGTAGFELDGVTTGDNAGWSVAAGDINKDGKADIIIGAPGATYVTNGGSTYVVFGGSGAWTSPISLSGLNGSAGTGGTNGTFGFRLDGSGGNSGTAVASGDVNGDGTADILIGGPYYNNTGIVYVMFGSSTAWSSGVYNLSSLAGSTGVNGTNGFAIVGPTNARIGISLATGDVNGDDTKDIIIGAAGNAGVNAAVYGVFGGTCPKSGCTGGGWPASVTLSNAWLGNGGSASINGFTLTGSAAMGGIADVSAGDITADNKAEIFVGLGNINVNGNTDAGLVYTIYGTSKFSLTSPLSGF